MHVPRPELIHVEDTLWVAASETGAATYDFRFEDHFACRRPWEPPPVEAVARMGAVGYYDTRYSQLAGIGITLVHTPEEHLRCSQLPEWYPLLEDMTPRSIWFEETPNVEEVEAHFNWPIFMKGERQTSRHQRQLSIIDGRDAFHDAIEIYSEDPILRWQRIVCRELVALRTVGTQSPLFLPRAFEFRTFWWRGQFAGYGHYWIGEHYDMTADERRAALAVAEEAARRLKVAFVAVDIAQRIDGRWIVIECNDGQDSGFAGASPVVVWRRILDIERAH